MVNKNNKKAFTLVELLVVISIIALLMSILMPSLQKARDQAKVIYCKSNIKSQHLAQTMYAVDNDGRFAEHLDYGPGYYKSGISGQSKIHEGMKDTYINNSAVMLCPLLRPVAKRDASTGYCMDNTWTYREYGAWDTDSVNIVGGYLWFANYTFINGSKTVFQFEGPNGESISEPSWPNKLSECTSSKAFITHFISISDGILVQDVSHNGFGQVWGNFNLSDATASDNPVGYSDGHVELHKRSRLRPRTKTETGRLSYLYY